MTIKRAHSDKGDAGGSISSQSDQFVMEPTGLKWFWPQSCPTSSCKAVTSPQNQDLQNGAAMFRKLTLTTILVALAATPAFAQKQRFANVDANGNLDALIARHAAANNLPEDLVRRVIKRESGGNARAVSAGNYGLMQIKLPTARSMGYTGTAAGLLDADTNMTYAVKYLAGAYRVANGNSSRAVHYYAAGYYYAAKNRGMAMPSSDRTSKLPQSKSWGGPTHKARALHRRPVFIADVWTTTDRGASRTDLYLRRAWPDIAILR
jgi:hypothetical protein